MIFALLFILAFIVGLVVYLISDRWWIASLICVGLFVLDTLSDVEASEFWSITLIFGLPIVLVASLLGAYVVELRRGIEEPLVTSEADPEPSTKSDVAP